MITKYKIFEALSIKDRVLTYLLKCLKQDKSEYRYIWSDRGWLYTEFLNFIDKDFTSYIYKEFFNKINYDVIENILIEEYPDIYSDALFIVKSIRLDDYLINKDAKKYNL